MARKPDTPCAGGCGKLLWGGSTSLPAGERKCQPCRVAVRAQRATVPKVRQPRPVRHWRCEVCGRDYRRSYSKQRTCGRVCGLELKRREEPLRPPKVECESKPRACINCGELFLPTRATHKACSTTCAAEHMRNLQRPRSCMDRVPRVCDCGAALTGIRRKCESCVTATRRQRKRQDKRRRRALKLGVATERYTLAEIAERDRRHCQLCRKRVAMTKAVPHSKAPTIDHVVPLADGGDDTRANVQLAHFECNSMKRDGGTQQLALVG